MLKKPKIKVTILKVFLKGAIPFYNPINNVPSLRDTLTQLDFFKCYVYTMFGL